MYLLSSLFHVNEYSGDQRFIMQKLIRIDKDRIEQLIYFRVAFNHLLHFVRHRTRSYHD